MQLPSELSGIIDLSVTFPIPTLENAHKLILGEYLPTLLDWKFPVFFSITYCIIVFIWRSLLPKTASKDKSFLFKQFILWHNIALCVFSAITFANLAPRMFVNYTTRSLYDAYCDTGSVFWNDSLGYWTYLFYLSKYYEVIDTLILLLKGQKPSLLQSYHHSGAIIALWLGSKIGTSAIWLFVVFNSFIHTIMYFYYTLTILGFQPSWKRYLTTMQICQFLIAGTMGVSYLLIPNCQRAAHGTERIYELMAHCYVVFYLIPLTALFVDFAKKTYHSKDVKDKKDKKKKSS